MNKLHIELPWECKPDFINELGVKWWLDKETTQYARREDRNGIKLRVICYVIEEVNGRRTRVLIDEEREIIEEDQTLEGIGSKIDVRKFLKRTE